MTNVTLAINTDTQDLAYGTSGVDWTEINSTNDQLIFSNGSDVVKDGEAIPSSDDLNQASIVIDLDNPEEIIVSKYFIADLSANLLKEIHNMGNQNKRYVLAFDFDGATASEPVLEIWDDEDYDTIDNDMLGAGVATSSWVRGVVTTDGLPGTDWTGSRLAGSSSGHFLWLNNQNGALTTAKTLYANLKVIVPSSATTGFAVTPVFIVKYTTN